MNVIFVLPAKFPRLLYCILPCVLAAGGSIQLVSVPLDDNNWPIVPLEAEPSHKAAFISKS